MTTAAEYVEATLNELKERAERFNCELIVSTPTTLLIDIDTQVQHEVFKTSSAILAQANPKMICNTQSWTSRHGEGTHYLIELTREKTAHERVALQCALGSDPKRESLCLRKMHEGNGEIIVLYKPKENTK